MSSSERQSWPLVATICVSVVSHGHGQMVAQLLGELAALQDHRLRRVILTLNLPEPGLAGQLRRRPWPFALHIVDNPAPLGFGANHNQACSLDAQQGPCDAFAVVNPDIRLRGNPFDALLACLAADVRVGLAYPIQVAPDGERQDHARLVPTPLRLLRRYLRGTRRPELPAGACPDWVNAAFLVLPREVYAAVGGFDAHYRMYCEDVDLCLRVQLAGWRLAQASEALVVHEAQRASRQRLGHLIWHLGSLLRLWRSPVWRAYRAAQAHEGGFTTSADPR